jgi:hypothetical protein
MFFLVESVFFEFVFFLEVGLEVLFDVDQDAELVEGDDLVFAFRAFLARRPGGDDGQCQDRQAYPPLRDEPLHGIDPFRCVASDGTKPDFNYPQSRQPPQADS